MPNWCANKLSFNTKNDDLIKYFESLNSSEDPKLFSHFVPEPDYHDKTDWYDWRWASWGTKSEACDLHVEITKLPPEADGLVLVEAYFNTAWAPPIPFLIEFERQTSIPVVCHYYEPNEEFSGIYRDGLVESYDFNPDGVPKEIYEEFGIDPEGYWDFPIINFVEPTKGEPWIYPVGLDRRRRQIEKGPSLLKRFATYIRSNLLSI